jgi:hypothetical protein
MTKHFDWIFVCCLSVTAVEYWDVRIASFHDLVISWGIAPMQQTSLRAQYQEESLALGDGIAQWYSTGLRAG